jgi:DNA-binding NarL/FixJ family response regulator
MTRVRAVRVLIVDDHPVVRAGLAAILENADDLHVGGEVGSAEAALEVMAEVQPHVCLVDVRLPGMSGIELSAEIARRYPDVRSIALSAQGDAITVDSAFEAGARGFVLKTSEPSVIVHAIRAVASGEVVLDPALEARAGSFGGRLSKGPFGLTPQEMRVLEHLPRGLTNKRIGESLGITEDTVKTHIKRILFKMKAHDRAEAVAIAHREGLL